MNTKDTLFQLKVNLEGVPGARMKMISLHATQEHWGVTITSMDVCIPTSSKDPQGIPACLESDPPFLEGVQRAVQWHLHEISRTAGFLARLAAFKWKLSVSAKWWSDTRTDFPISGIPHLMAGCDFPLCVCVCMCMLHLHATTSEGCRKPVVPGEPKGSQAVSSSLGQQKPFHISHSWKSLCAGFT